jgi:hypothetical protein
MNKFLIILGIILILINTTIEITRKTLYIIIFVLSIKYMKHLRSTENVSKTYYINVKSSNKYVNLMADTLDYILKKRNWVKLDNMDAKNSKKIGFTFSNIDKINVLKSQINFRILTQNSEIFSDKIVFKEYFKDTDYYTNYYVLNRSNIVSNINLLYDFVKSKNNKNKFILKDPYGSLGKQILLFDHNNTSKSYKKKVQIYISLFKSQYIILDEYLDPITFSVPELSFNHSKINIETEYGRRSLIRFYIVVIVKNNKVEIYKVNNLFIYLAVLPSNGNISKDINKLGTYITNYYLGNKLRKNQMENLTDDEKMNINLYRDLLYKDNNNYNNELFTKLFCISNDEFKRQYPDKCDLVDNKINDFITKFSEIYHDEFSCKNDKCLNDDFNSCFNIYAVDSILTKKDEFKVLEINNSPGNIMLNMYNKVKNIYNTINIFNDIFDIIEDDKSESTNLTLITNKERFLYNKTYYLSENQVITYPEIINSLKKRNYLRSLWSSLNNSNKNIDLYLGYIIKNNDLIEEDKELYINYVSAFLNNYSMTNKIEGAIFELGDKSILYNHLKNTNMIPEFVSFNIYKDEKNYKYIKTKELLEIETFINTNLSRCSRYILKPSLGSQGDGIVVIKYYEEFNDWYKKQDKYIEWTISEFLSPKLLQSLKLKEKELRKVHIRSYFIVVNDKYDNTKIYELKSRVVYFAVDKYIPKCVNVDKDNKYAFITNLALASEERNIEYDTRNYTDDLLNYQDQIFNFKKLSNLITEYGIECINILDDINIKCLNKNNKEFKGCYQILAIDYLPVNKNNIKILEVNKGPGFKALKVNFNLEDIFDEIFKVSIDKFDGIEYSDSELKYLNRVK